MKKDLDNLKGKIINDYNDLIDDPTTNWLNSTIDKFQHPEKYKERPTTLFSFIQTFIDAAPHRIIPKTGRPASYKMIREYTRTFYYLEGFCKHKGREYDFKDIDLDFYDDFMRFLTSKNLALNTIGKKIQTLKIFLNNATDKGVNKNLKFKSSRFASLSEDSDNIYLNEQELQLMLEKDLSQIPKLETVRDMFLIGCWTGLRYNDWSQVRTENIKNGFIELNQAKTGNKVIIPLHPTVQFILEKYNGNLPTPISNQKFNQYLKEVAEKVKFKEAVTKQITRGGKKESTIYHKWQLVKTHTARRSFATNAYKAGVPSITIMSMTGHRTESSFLKYIKVTLQEHAEKMKNIWLENGTHLKIAK
jgi:integrase